MFIRGGAELEALKMQTRIVYTRIGTGERKVYEPKF